MPIQVICPGCHSRFSVSDKFAGQTGPCPKCKKPMTIPTKEEEVVIHAPEPAGPKDAKGRSALKPIKKKEFKVSLPVMVGTGLAIVLVPLLAFLLRSTVTQVEGMPRAPWPIMILGAIALAPPLVMAGYTFLRNDELGAHTGRELWIRVAICSLVYALLWGVYAYTKHVIVGPGQTPETFHLLFLLPVPIIAGTVASLATLELDATSAVFHYSLYLLVTVGLRWILGIGLF